jgi:uracil-DNA glycosylase
VPDKNAKMALWGVHTATSVSCDPTVSQPLDNAARLRRIARQHAETALLLGIDVLPLATMATASSPADLAAGGVADATRIATVPGDSRGSAADALRKLMERHDAACPHCTLVTSHTRTVFGEGNPDADLMFIGEAPGEEEDRTGRPFVGRAGRKLDEIIAAMGFCREQVYIANVLKSRPPNNRTPLQAEVDACSPFLEEQIRIIRPRAIVALGGPAAKLLLRTDTGITRLRGVWGRYVDESTGLEIPLMPTYHPAYVLRNYTPETRRQVWSDMQAVLALLQGGQG